MKRFENWPAMLLRYIESRRDMPFDYERGNDCVMFAAGAIEAMTGENPLRHEYSSVREARAILRANGGLFKMIDAIFERCTLQELQRGDIAVTSIGGRKFIAVVFNQFAIAPGREGIIMNPIMACEFGWKVARG